MNNKKNLLSATITSIILCTASGAANAGAYERPPITESDIARAKNKYSRVVLFGDSQLDTGNITKSVDVSTGSLTFPFNLPLGAPFTPDTGNMAQQLVGTSFLNTNPLDWKANFNPFWFMDLPVHVKGTGGPSAMNNSAHTNMAQGGAKLLTVFPGKDKSILEKVAKSAIATQLNPDDFVYNFAVSAANSVIANMDERNIILINKITDQPAQFKAAGGTFNQHDLAIIMAGGNDVIEQGYSGARSLDVARNELTASRKDLVKDIINLGAKNILLGNIPDIRVTPTLLEWHKGEFNPLHAGVANEKADAENKIGKLTAHLNEQTTVAALNIAPTHPGITITLLDTFQLIRHVALSKENYGIEGDLNKWCDQDIECRKGNNADAVKYLTQDALHPSEATSKVLADAYRNYLRDPAKPLWSRLESDRPYDAYLDAFVDIASLQEGDTVQHHIKGGVLDVSFQEQADALSNVVRLDGGLLYVNTAAENLNNSSRTQTLNADLLISPNAFNIGGGGIDISAEHSSLIYSGSASGGAFIKSGPGNLILTGNNTFAGLAISGGSVQVGNGADHGWVTGLIYNNAILEFNRIDDKEFNNRIEGTGLLVKAGLGRLNLTGSGGMTGRTEVRNGGLGFNSVFNATDVRVYPGAFVYGTGTVKSLNLEAGATISPGNSIGTFTVEKDIIFNKGSIYAVEANASGASDSINVGGIADIRGGDVRVQAESGDYGPQYEYTVLNAKDHVAGNFDTVFANFAFLDPRLKYGMTDVKLLLTRNDIKPADLCQSGNSKAACAELLPEPPQSETAVAPVAPMPEPEIAIAPVTPTPEPEIAVAPVTPTPEPEIAVAPVTPTPEPEITVVPVAPTSTVEIAAVPLAPVAEPQATIEPIVLAPTQDTVEKSTVAPVVEKIITHKKNDLVDQENAVVLGMSRAQFMQFSTFLPGNIHPTVKTILAQESSTLRDSISNRLYETKEGLAPSGAWGHVFGSEGRQQGTNGISSLSRNSQGFILGSDMQNEDLSLGLFGGYQKSSMSQGVASADVGTYNIGIYGAKRYEALSVRLGASFSWHEIETARKIYYKDKVSSPKADYHANSAQVFSELAYDVKVDQFNIEPYLGLSYTRIDVAKFSEEQELFSLKGKREAKNIYAGKLGARINYAIQYNDNVSVNFQTGAGVKHTFSDLSSSTDMGFRSHDNDFSVAGLPLKRNVVQLNAKVALRTKNGFSTGLDYQAEKAGGMRDQSVSAYGSWEF